MSDIRYHNIIRDYDVAIDNQIHVELLDRQLWMDLFRETNEMFATVLGSSLVPELRIRITGLDQYEMYAACIEFDLRSDRRWKYVNGEWKAYVSRSFHEFKVGFMHPDSYQNGFGWMEKPVTFRDMKISVNEFAAMSVGVSNIGNMVFLNPYSKYVPVIKIFKLEDGILLTHVYSKILEMCNFITVVAYRNPKMIQKKGRVAAYRGPEVYLLRPEEQKGIRTFPNEEYIRDLATFVPKTLKVQDMKSIEFIWSSALFAGGNRMNFFTFVELYQIKNNMCREGYSLNLFINEIENNNLNLPNINLNVSGRSEGNQPMVFEGANSPARTSTPSAQGAVGGAISRETLSDYDTMVKDAFMDAFPDHYVVKNALPLVDFLDAFLNLQSKLPRVSEEVLEELRRLMPIH